TRRPATRSGDFGVALSNENAPRNALPRAVASSRTAKVLTVIRGSIAQRARHQPRATLVAVQLLRRISHARAYRGIRRLNLTVVRPGGRAPPATQGRDG